jgi:hypothetical protein
MAGSPVPADEITPTRMQKNRNNYRLASRILLKGPLHFNAIAIVRMLISRMLPIHPHMDAAIQPRLYPTRLLDNRQMLIESVSQERSSYVTFLSPCSHVVATLEVLCSA